MTASDSQRKLAAASPPDEPVAGSHEQPESIPPRALLAHVLDRANLQRALKQVRRNQVAPGIDGMTVDELPEYLKHHWVDIRTQLEAGHYRPQPVKRVDIPKGDGKTRPLGIPTVLDRFIQQAIAQDKKLKVADAALAKLKDRVRELTRRTRGNRLEVIAAGLRESLLGWKAYFGSAEVLSPLRDIDKWVRRKLRCYIWKQWGSAGYRELRKRGVSVREAWNTSKSAHGPWRLSKTAALALALPLCYFKNLGVPSLAAR